MKKLGKVILYFAFIFLGQFSFGQSVTFLINLTKTAQTIDNFGASGAWYTEGIGKYWPAEKKERMAELLFSKAFDSSGHPLGIGLSAWRFNLGGGTAEQGDSSGIRNAVRRVECFLSPDGTYHWEKQAGYLWFTRKAAKYGVENLIAFSNTPPVQFTKNGLGFKTKKDFETNLREDEYVGYATFLTTVLQHFEKEGIHFNYISPVNEPQWDWSGTFGQMNQEGSPWHNKDIYSITKTVDSVLLSEKLKTKILLPEAGNLTSLYEGRAHATRQIQTFYGKDGPEYMGSFKRLHPVIAGHSYFTDAGDSTIVTVRKKLRDTAAKYHVSFWQSEYSMLGDGYKEGMSGRRQAIDCALFLSKIIHHDLTVADATAWQFWNAWEPSRGDMDTRYCLLALQTNKTNTEGEFTITKNLWALGHYSRFVRPGMKRLLTNRSDGLTDIEAASDIMLSAFTDGKQVVVVAINYTQETRDIRLKISELKKFKTITQYITTAGTDDNMKKSGMHTVDNISLQPRSICTIIIDIKNQE